MKLLLYLLICILVVNIIVSLVLGHLVNYYNPSIKAIYSGVMGAMLGIIFIIIVLTAKQYNY